MFESKSISLRSYVLRVAMRKSQSVSGGNLSNYITMLISKDNETDIAEELKEERKPIRDSSYFQEQFGDNYCTKCGEHLLIGDIVCYAIFSDGTPRSVVHKNCCREKDINF